MSGRLVPILSLLLSLGSLALPSTALAQGASLEAASEQDKAVASEEYGLGMQSFQSGDAATALEHFKKSYQAVRSPNSHLMVGKALIDLGRHAEAYRELEATAREADEAARVDAKYQQTGQAARDELKALRRELVELSVKVVAPTPNTVVRINGTDHPLSEFGEPMMVAPGALEVALVENGQVVSTESTTPSAGDQLEMTLQAPETSEAPTPVASAPAGSEDTTTKKPFPHRRSMAYVAGGVGVAGLVGFGVFGLLNNAKYSDAKDQCDDGICPRDVRRDANRGHSYQTAANVSFIAGVVGAVTCVSLLLTEDSGDTALVPSTRLSVGLDRVTLQGSF